VKRECESLGDLVYAGPALRSSICWTCSQICIWYLDLLTEMRWCVQTELEMEIGVRCPVCVVCGE